MKQAFLMMVLMIVINLTIKSENVHIEKARQVALNFYSEKIQNPAQIFTIGEEYHIKVNGITTCYAFNVNSGFVIVSAESTVFPILGYSFTSNYAGTNFPPAFSAWMDYYHEQILYGIEKKRIAPENIKKAWLKYASNGFMPGSDFMDVEPLVKTTWHQGCYYNSLFPADTSGPCGYLWTGCVATAMGQIMKYYNYPANGTGSFGYNTPYGWLEADFENTTYDWAGMKHHLNSENFPVAQLLFHAAISVSSQLYPSGTGAYDFDARDALVDYFGYKSDAQFFWRDSYPGDWKVLLREELDAGRPVLYGCASSETFAGHTLVCDGYQDTAFFHFNWGWNGVYNGYFYLDSLVAGNNYFDFQHDAVVGITPDISGPIVTNPPVDLFASVNDHVVTLTWEHSSAISSLELIGYYVYRNDSLLTEAALLDVIYIDSNVPPGSFEYKVQSVYIGQGYGPSASAEAYVSSISESEDSYFQIYPNPATEHIFIGMTNQTSDKALCFLMDLNGRILDKKEINFNMRGIEKFDVSSFVSGVYLFQVREGSKIYSKKLVIKK